MYALILIRKFAHDSAFLCPFLCQQVSCQPDASARDVAVSVYRHSFLANASGYLSSHMRQLFFDRSLGDRQMGIYFPNWQELLRRLFLLTRR